MSDFAFTRNDVLRILRWREIGMLLCAVFLGLFCAGCVVVKVYPKNSADKIEVHRGLGVFWLRPPTNTAGFCVDSRGIGVSKGLDGFIIGYHDVRAVVGMPTNAVVVFGNQTGKTETYILTNLGVILPTSQK